MDNVTIDEKFIDFFLVINERGGLDIHEKFMGPPGSTPEDGTRYSIMDMANGMREGNDLGRWYYEMAWDEFGDDYLAHLSQNRK